MSSTLDLFGANSGPELKKEVHRREVMPLAARLRPKTLDDFVGQERVLGPGKPLRRWIETDRVPSLILWGPPGVGKTTLAEVISHHTRAAFEKLSAVMSGVKDIKEVVERARLRREQGHRTLLFVDEIHRFNKSQQDALLPHVESGLVTLVGATTENPSYALNHALLSRARVIRFEGLARDGLEKLVRRALADVELGLAGVLSLTDDAIEWLIASAEGDARRVLSCLEIVALTAQGSERPLGQAEVKAALESALSRQPIRYDRDGDEHYQTISAFIKSLRASDPDAALYYLARMIEGGEDPMFIVRRLVIFAAEDVGNADPRGIQIAVAVKDAIELVGMPEGRIPLAQAVTYLASAPKSNASYLAIDAALEEVRRSGPLPVLNARLPLALEGKRFYHPQDSGLEKVIRERLNRIEK